MGWFDKNIQEKRYSFILLDKNVFFVFVFQLASFFCYLYPQTAANWEIIFKPDPQQITMKITIV